MLIACSSYREISINKKYKPDNTDYKNPYYAIIHEPEQKNKPKENTFSYTRIKYLIIKCNDKNLDLILEQSYEKIIDNNYHSAEILLKDASTLWNNGAAENNLAIIYEITGEKNLAFKMYTKALLLAPENEKFKINFLNFINRNDPDI